MNPHIGVTRQVAAPLVQPHFDATKEHHKHLETHQLPSERYPPVMATNLPWRQDARTSLGSLASVLATNLPSHGLGIRAAPPSQVVRDHWECQRQYNGALVDSVRPHCWH